MLRKRMAFVPCGHAPSCTECFRVLNTNKTCPLCRTKIGEAVVLQGIYWNQAVVKFLVQFNNEINQIFRDHLVFYIHIIEYKSYAAYYS